MTNNLEILVQDALSAVRESLLLDFLEDHYVMTLAKSRVHPRPSKIQRVTESGFCTLYLRAGKKTRHTMNGVLNRWKKSVAALFERAYIGSTFSNVQPSIEDEFLDRIVELVVSDGMNDTSLTFRDCLLRYNHTLRLPRLLETNHLEALELLQIGRAHV